MTMFTKSLLIMISFTFIMGLSSCTIPQEKRTTVEGEIITATNTVEPSPPPTDLPAIEATGTPLPTPTDILAAETPVLTLELDTERGKELAESVCIVCHSFDRIASKQKSQAEWENTVKRMVGLGAILSESDQPLVIQYLAETYKQ
jgi:cytochrome c5